MNKQNIGKIVKVVVTILLLGTGAYFGVDTSSLTKMFASTPDIVVPVPAEVSHQVIQHPLPLAPAVGYDAGAP